jgi:hypothetical protein
MKRLYANLVIPLVTDPIRILVSQEEKMGHELTVVAHPPQKVVQLSPKKKYQRKYNDHRVERVLAKPHAQASCEKYRQP